jgi:hypothetical protein
MPNTQKLKLKTQIAIYVVGRSKISHVSNEEYDATCGLSHIKIPAY